MDQTLNDLKAQLEAQQAEIEAMIKQFESMLQEDNVIVDRRRECASRRLSLDLPEAAVAELESLSRKEHDWTHQRESANYTIAVLCEIRTTYSVCGGPWALAYSILAMGASYLIHYTQMLRNG